MYILYCMLHCTLTVQDCTFVLWITSFKRSLQEEFHLQYIIKNSVWPCHQGLKITNKVCNNILGYASTSCIINIACINMESSYNFTLHCTYKYTTVYCTYSTHTPLFASLLYATVFFTTVYITVYTFDSTCIIIILIHNHYHHCTYFTICIYMFHLYFNSSGLYNFTENQFARRVSHRTRAVYLILIILSSLTVYVL